MFGIAHKAVEEQLCLLELALLFLFHNSGTSNIAAWHVFLLVGLDLLEFSIQSNAHCVII